MKYYILIVAILLTTACKKSSFDDAFDPRALKDAISTWIFSDPSDYEYDENHIEVSGNKAQLKQVGVANLSEGSYNGTFWDASSGLLTLRTSGSGLDIDIRNLLVSKAPDLIGYWKFESDFKNVIDNSAGTTNGNAAVGSPSRLGNGAGVFDGTGDYVEYSSLPYNFSGANVFSAVAWVYMTDDAADNYIVGSDGNLGWYFAVHHTPEYKFIVKVDDGVDDDYDYSPTVLIPGRWYHLGIVNTGSRLKGYINGRLEIDIAHTNIGDLSDKLLIGAINFGGAINSLNGRIDELAIYKAELSGADIQSVYENQNIVFADETELDSGWVPQRDHLTNYWKFNGNALTSIGSNVLTPTGGPTFSTDRKLGSHAVEFDGATQDYSVPRQKDYVNGVTVSTWMKIDSWTGSSAPLLFRINGQTWYPRLRVQSTGAVHWQYRIGGGTLSSNSAVGLVKSNEWRHIVATLSGPGGGRVYVDGVLVATNATTGTGVSGGANTMLLGRDTDIGTFLDGKMDDVGIWDVVLTDEEIKLLYERQAAKYTGVYTSPAMDLGAAGSWSNFKQVASVPYYKELTDVSGSEIAAEYPGVTGGLMSGIEGLWHFNETAGAITAADSSGNSNNGGVNGAVTLGGEGKLRTAANFDGSTGYVEIANTGDINQQSVKTIAFWIKKSGDTGNGQPYSYPLRKSGGAAVLQFYLNNGSPATLSFAKGQPIAGAASVQTTINNHEWNHIVAVIRPTLIEIYKNGVLIQSAAANELTNNDANPWRVGTYLSGWYHFNGMIDELAFWSRPLDPIEVVQLYRRAANRLQYQVRTCDDAACAGETWLGPNGTADTYFSELHNYASIDATGNGSGAVQATPLQLDFSDFSTAGLTVPSNRYFQYRVVMASEDENSLCESAPGVPANCVPELTALTVGPDGRYYAGNPSISNKSGIPFSDLINFVAAKNGSCIPKYQISNNGIDYYYWDNTGWAAATGGMAQANSVADVQAHLPAFAAAAGAGNFFFKAYLPSDTTQSCELNSVLLHYKEAL